MFVKHLFCSILLLLFYIHTQAQLTETFSDSDFIRNPEWFISQPADWQINSGGKLQSQSTVSNNTFWISTQQSLVLGVEWLVEVELDFNPSSANYIDLFVIASDSNLNADLTTGYFVRIGNTDDELSLYRKDAGNKITKIIDGRNGLLNKSNNKIQIRVLRDSSSKWYLFSNTDETRFVEEGRITDNTYIFSRFFGCLVRQSTAGFFQKHFLDNIRIGAFIPDTIPPKLQLGYASTDSSVELIFNEFLLANSILQEKFQFGEEKIQPVAVKTEANKINLSFPKHFDSGQTYLLCFKDLEDEWGNRSISDSILITYLAEQPHELLITEIMADPVPVVGLPESEWIEIQNTGKRIVSLKGWVLKDASVRSEKFPDRLLFPDSCLILCPRSVEKEFQEFGAVIGLTSFPSLNNESDTLQLLNNLDQPVHIIPYEKSWYRNLIKSEGGWSLEMIDPKNPCGDKFNWAASIHTKGGTPGKRNSVIANNKDLLNPRLLRAFASDVFTLNLFFDEPLDFSSASDPAHYEILGENINIQTAIPIAPLYNRVKLKLHAALDSGKMYTVRVKELRDCAGNEVGSFHTTSVALPQRALKGELIINEILFDPKTNGVDYVEIFNRSNKTINLKTLLLAGRNSRGELEQISPLVKEDRLIFPGDYLLASPNADVIEELFIQKNAAVFVSCNPFPTLPNESGTIVLVDSEGMLIDALNYESDWHFPLLKNREGVALERIHPQDSTQKKENWTSASADVGFGTPGVQNSQYLKEILSQGTITVDPSVFSPDNNGTDDYLFIRYQFESGGYVLNAIIYDLRGNRICRLAKNLLCGVEGFIRWDGLDDWKRPLATGPYLIQTEIFHPSGKVKRMISRVVLVRK